MVTLGSVDDYASRVLIEARMRIRELRLDQTLTSSMGGNNNAAATTEDPPEFVADGAKIEKGGKGKGEGKEKTPSGAKDNKRKTVLCQERL
eukprot:6335467-Amphidinium_carterae.2